MPGNIEIEVIAFGHRIEHGGMPLAAVYNFTPGSDSPVADTGFRLSDNKVGIDDLQRTQTCTGRTGSVRTVKAEGTWRDLRQANSTIDTGRFLGKEHLLSIDNRDQHNTVAQFQCRLKRIGQALPEGWIDLFVQDSGNIRLRDAVFVPVLLVGRVYLVKSR